MVQTLWLKYFSNLIRPCTTQSDHLLGSVCVIFAMVTPPSTATPLSNSWLMHSKHTARVCTITITPYQLGNMTAIDSFSLMIIIIITTTMFMVLSSWQSHCDSSPGSFDECRMVPSGRRPKTKPDDLGCESACTGCQKLHPPSSLLLLSPKADIHFTVQQRVEG